MHDSITIDEECLKSLESAIGKEKTNNYLSRFIEEFPVKILEMEEALSNSDYSRLQLLTHTYASSAASFGATSLYDICRQIEDKCINSLREHTKENLDEVQRIGQASCDQLKTYL
jgi:HPt (histidine-containing phosphotransfer) domain-containing protein